MPNRIVQQPNGLLAIFSSIVDDFTHMNCTEAVVTHILSEQFGWRDIATKILHAREDRLANGYAAGDGLTRWAEALLDIKMRYGETHANDRRSIGEESRGATV